MSPAVYMVFTDLDGTLLDHHDYGFAPALPALAALGRAAIPVIPATSKTRAEVEPLRERLENSHPFIVENGAAIYIPVGYVAHQPEGTTQRDGYWVREFAQPREHWLQTLAALRGQFPREFDYFHRAGVDGIAAMTGLTREQAALANRREYSEPVQWLGSDRRKPEFVRALADSGASVLQGGRFLCVAGDCDKGRALAWLRATYLKSQGAAGCHDLAAGDSDNDIAMLNAAQTALLVRSPAHDFPALERGEGVIRSREYGPAGWSEGVMQWLHGLRVDC